MGCSISKEDPVKRNRDLEAEFGPPIYPIVFKGLLFMTDQSSMYPEVAKSLSIDDATNNEESPI